MIEYRRSVKLIFLLGAALTGIAVAAQPSATSRVVAPQLADVGNVAAAIAQSERALVNIRVDAKTRVEDYDERSKSWVYAGGQDVTGYYNGDPGVEARVDYHSQVGKWVNGPHPFATSVFSVAYNGRVGTRLYTRMGNDEDSAIVPQGWIETNRPAEITDIGSYATGWSFSLYGLFERESLRASQVFKAWPLLKARYVIFQGVRCIELFGPGDHDSTATWWLDPARGFAVLGTEAKRGDGLIDKVVIEQLDNPAPNVYYPLKATREILPVGRPPQRITYVATKVVANDPNFSRDIFMLHFPAGTQIHDQFTGHVFKAGPTTQALARSLKDQARAVSAALQTPPTAQSNSHWWWVLLAAAGLVVIAFIAVLLRRRRMHRHLPSLLAGCLLCLGGMNTAYVRAAVPPSIRQVPSIRFDNCGLNAVMFILDYCQQPVDILQLEDEMALGRQCENRASLDAIKRVLEEKHFAVEAFRSPTIDGVWSKMGTDSIAVLYTAPGSYPAGHFYDLVGNLSGHTIVVDPGLGWRWQSHEDLHNQLQGRFGGVWLIVAPTGVAAMKPCAIWTTTSDIKTTVTQQFGNLVIPVRFFNNEKESVTLVGVTGDCGCFRGTRPQLFALEPGGVGSLSFLFDGSEFGAGNVNRDVAVKLRAGSRTQTHIVHLDFSVVDPPDGRVIWVPHQIDFGSLHRNQKNLEMQTVTLTIPSKFAVKGVSAGPDHIKVWVKGRENTATAESVKLSPLHEVEVGIDVSQLPDGPFAEQVIVATNHPQYSRIVIPITGELRE